MRAIAATAFAALVAVTSFAGSAEAKYYKPFPNWGGPALVFGLAGAAIAASAYGYSESCIRWEPVIDYYGNVVGHRRVNICY